MTDDLLSWYDAHQRALPWRGDGDPYHVWLSEVMLQQTQVQTVIPYYHSWLERFPLIDDVARASGDDILKLWEGLGYYRRARHFHAACKIVSTNYGGDLPTDPAAFRALPGVGAYTFAAVRSISFGDAIPAVDGNLKRVAARLFKLDSAGQSLTKATEPLLKEIMPPDRPGDFNQSLMDLGATICTSSNPHCTICPISDHCLAFATGTVADYPVKVPRPIRPHYNIVVGIIRKESKILIDRRPEEGLLGGLWEFPGGKIEENESAADAIRREIMEEVGLEVSVGQHAGTIEHAYTHFTISMAAYMCDWVSGEPQNLACTDTRWIDWDELGEFAFPGANRKLWPLVEPLLQRRSIIA